MKLGWMRIQLGDMKIYVSRRYILGNVHLENLNKNFEIRLLLDTIINSATTDIY